MASNADLMVYTDGAARGNPGPAGAGYAIFGRDGRLVESRAKLLGRRTNNEAEYEALIWAMRRARDISQGSVRFHSDSELMVRQVNGEYRVKKEHLKPLFEKVRAESAGFRDFKLVNVPREDERIQFVDSLVNETLDREGF